VPSNGLTPFSKSDALRLKSLADSRPGRQTQQPCRLVLSSPLRGQPKWRVQTDQGSYRTFVKMFACSHGHGANRTRFFITSQSFDRTDTGRPVPTARSHARVAHLGTDPALLPARPLLQRNVLLALMAECRHSTRIAASFALVISVYIESVTSLSPPRHVSSRIHCFRRPEPFELPATSL
jgi:hypothetical protein